MHDYEDSKWYNSSWEIEDGKLSIGIYSLKIIDIEEVRKGESLFIKTLDWIVSTVFFIAIIAFLINKISGILLLIILLLIIFFNFFVFNEKLIIIMKDGYKYKFSAILPQHRKRLVLLGNILDSSLKDGSIVNSMSNGR